MSTKPINPLEAHNAVVPLVGGNLPTYGFTVFWTVRSHIWEKDEIEQWSSNLPEEIKLALLPNDLISSFESATNLEGERKVHTTKIESDNGKAFFTSRKLSSTERVIVREVVDPTGKRVSMLNIGTISLDLDKANVEVNQTWNSQDFSFEDTKRLIDSVNELLLSITEKINARSSGIEDQKIRTGIQKWVTARHGVSLRGRGGVYFIPHYQSIARRDKLVDEIKAIQTFLSNDIGTIFGFEVVSTETLDKEDLITVLLEEVEGELNPLMQELENSQNLSDRKLTGLMQRVSVMQEKFTALNQTFDNRFADLSMKLNITRNAVSTMLVESL